MSIRNALLDGERVDVRILDGRIHRIAPLGTLELRGPVLEADGGFLTPPYADPHLHLDAVLLAQRRPNESGTLEEGIANWARHRPSLTEAGLLHRATVAVKWCVAQGTGRIRTHVDCGSRLAVEVMCQFREEVSHLIDLQVVAFPQEGVFNAPGQQADLEWAAANGVDAVGAIPHHESTTQAGKDSISLAFDLAERHGLHVDLHCDETDDPESQHILWVCEQKRARNFSNHVLAGHCTAMHSYAENVAEKTINAVAETGVQVVANPLDNIVLQGRGDGYPRRRGITRIPELLKAGAKVGIGHDSIMDPWYPLGRGHLIDAASMLIHVAQMTRPNEIRRVHRILVDDNHEPFGGAPTLQEGAVADLLVHAVAGPEEVFRLRAKPRWVLRRGQVVAETPPAVSQVLGESLRPGLYDRGPS
ncbi:MAG: amidohydrolase family protein [Myxococcota bacterium]|nr:amidohydrolase family protein [Myxococcota bacterium]